MHKPSAHVLVKSSTPPAHFGFRNSSTAKAQRAQRTSYLRATLCVLRVFAVRINLESAIRNPQSTKLGQHLPASLQSGDDGQSNWCGVRIEGSLLIAHRSLSTPTYRIHKQRPHLLRFHVHRHLHIRMTSSGYRHTERGTILRDRVHLPLLRGMISPIKAP